MKIVERLRFPFPHISPPGYELLAYECHEGHYMLPNVLSASAPTTGPSKRMPGEGLFGRERGVQQGLDFGAGPLPGTWAREGGPPR